MVICLAIDYGLLLIPAVVFHGIGCCVASTSSVGAMGSSARGVGLRRQVPDYSLVFIRKSLEPLGRTPRIAGGG